MQEILNVKFSSDLKPDSGTMKLVLEFLETCSVFEINHTSHLVLLHDKKSDAHYFTCHLSGSEIALKSDLQATIDSDGDTLYKLNRDLLRDKSAFSEMVSDAVAGRSFEDLVLEYDPTYNEDVPLKVYGGQHRVEAIKSADTESVDELHGVRVYFNLTQTQKVEIAKINNTSIAVSNDLLDRMSEQLVGPQLRDWCQKIGLLDKNQDFKDRRDARYPTVRIARTIVFNYINGKEGSLEDLNDVRLVKSGARDDDYQKLRKKIDWTDKKFIEMGKMFTLLHLAQIEKIKKKSTKSKQPSEFGRKALSLSISAGWAFAAGLFQKHPDKLKILYELPNNVSSNADPLNAKALSEAKHKGHDPEKYRGLGTRTSPVEIGRVLELFIVLAEQGLTKIDKPTANAAIMSYEAKRSDSLAKIAKAKLKK